jgi:5'-nucleotidase
MVAALNADCALLNSGTLRSDELHKAGEFSLRDLLAILPMMDDLILLDVSGDMIHKALENGVSMWPKLEGRFPQVSGITFAFDPKKPAGSRVDPEFVKVGDEYLDMEQRYKLVTKAYLGKGKDGYDSLAKAEVMVDEEIAPNLTSAVQNHFQAIKMKQGKAGRKPSIHHQSLVTLSRKTSVVKQLESDGFLPPNRGVSPCRSLSPAISERGTKGRRPSRSKGVPSVDQLEAVACKLEPKVEGRIMQMTPEVRRRLQGQKEADLRRLTITEVDEKSSDDDEERAALFGKPGKGKAIAKKAPAKARKGNVSSDYDSDSEDISESEGSDIK